MAEYLLAALVLHRLGGVRLVVCAFAFGALLFLIVVGSVIAAVALDRTPMRVGARQEFRGVFGATDGTRAPADRQSPLTARPGRLQPGAGQAESPALDSAPGAVEPPSQLTARAPQR